MNTIWPLSSAISELLSCSRCCIQEWDTTMMIYCVQLVLVCVLGYIDSLGERSACRFPKGFLLMWWELNA
uniref:Uncharacterized protein n=1 Tax=Parascaris equorum TaxID=6256 RepID=A0A914RHS1_PAREQ